MSEDKGVEVAFPVSLEKQSISIEPGWNLVGINEIDSYDISILKDNPWITIVWQWDNLQNIWQVFFQEFDNEALEAFVAKKGFLKLEKLHYGEGFWIYSLETAELMLE